MKRKTANIASRGEDPFDALSDPIVRAAVDQAMEPYRDVVSAETYEEMRESLADFLVMHPVTDRLVRRLRPRTNVISGDEPVGLPADPAEPEDEAGSGRKVG